MLRDPHQVANKSFSFPSRSRPPTPSPQRTPSCLSIPRSGLMVDVSQLAHKCCSCYKGRRGGGGLEEDVGGQRCLSVFHPSSRCSPNNMYCSNISHSSLVVLESNTHTHLSLALQVRCLLLAKLSIKCAVLQPTSNMQARLRLP